MCTDPWETMYLVALLACGGTPEAPAAPPAAPAVEQEAWRKPLILRMHQHFIHATDAAYYVSLGELDKAKGEGRALADLDAPEMPEDWRGLHTQVRTAAAGVAEAPSLDAAADAVVVLGHACAACHVREGGPRVTVDEVVGSGWGTTTTMQRHQIAAYLMWVGVVVPSEGVFQGGVDELRTAHVLEPRVHEMAEAARRAGDAEARGQAMAAFLKACAGCHEPGAN